MAYSGSSTGNMTGNNDAASVGLSATDWSVVADKGGNGNFPGLNKAGQIRLYGSNSNHNVITVTSSVGTISSIVVTYGTSNYNALVKVGSTTITGTGSTNTEKTYAINSTSFSIAHNYSTTTQVYIISIVINYASSCTAPTIITDLLETEVAYTKGTTATPLSIMATGTDVTYQWYSNTSKSTTGATTLTGQTSSSYTPSTTTTGTKYYYCVASSSTCTTNSKFAKITVTAPKYTVTFDAGTGTCGTSSSTEGTAGAGVNLPVASPSSACGTDGWTFAGWATASQAETTTAPTLYAANSNYKPSSDCTLYAVYSKTESSGGGSSEVTFNFGYTDWGKSAQFSGSTYDEVSQEKSGITATYTRNSGSLYANTTSLRFYKSNTLTFDAGSNAISAITFTGTVGQEDITTDVATCSNTSSSLSWSGNSTSVTFTRPSDAASYATLTSATLTVSGGSTTTYNSNPSCATCSNLINIAKGTPSRGSFTLTGAGTDICADEPVTVFLSNITADPHYHATAVTSSNGGTPSAITDGSATVSNINASTTINVTFAEDTKVVVTLLNNNNPVNAGGFDAQGKKEYYTGETLGTLPTLTSDDACDLDSNHFMGWTTEQISTKRSKAPDFVDVDTPVNAAMTLRAVWAKAQ